MDGMQQRPASAVDWKLLVRKHRAFALISARSVRILPHRYAQRWNAQSLPAESDLCKIAKTDHLLLVDQGETYQIGWPHMEKKWSPRAMVNIIRRVAACQRGSCRSGS